MDKDYMLKQIRKRILILDNRYKKACLLTCVARLAMTIKLRHCEGADAAVIARNEMTKQSLVNAVIARSETTKQSYHKFFQKK